MLHEGPHVGPMRRLLRGLDIVDRLGTGAMCSDVRPVTATNTGTDDAASIGSSDCISRTDTGPYPVADPQPYPGTDTVSNTSHERHPDTPTDVVLSGPK